MLQIVKTKSFRILAGLVLLTALYALAGFVIAPKLIRSAITEDVPKTIAATATVGEIHLNPFLLQLTVNDLVLSGAGGEKLLGFQRLFVDFQLSSLWHRAYTFVNIDLTAPHVSAVLAKDGVLNLLQLVPKPTAPEKPPEKKEPLPPIRIGSLKVSQGLVTYEDRSRADVFAARLEPLNFELRDFTTGVEGGKFTFTAASKLGERLEWHGHVSVDPVSSDGEFQVNGLLAHTLWEYLQDQVNFVIDSGTIDLAGTYKFSLTAADTDAVRVELSKLAVRDLAVRLKGADAQSVPWVAVPSFEVSGITADLAKREAHIDLATLTGAKLVTWVEADGSLNLMKLAASPAIAAPAPGPGAAAAPVAPTVTATTAGRPPPPWRVDLRQFDIRDASIAAEDRGPHPTVKAMLSPLSLRINGASQDLSKPVDVTFDTRLNDSASLNVTGQVTPQPLLANVAVKLAGLDLTLAQPYLAQHTAMTLKNGTMGADLKVHYGVQPNTPALQVSGDVRVDKVHTVDDALHDDFVDWDRVDILGLNYRQGPDRLDIDQVVAHQLYARVIIESDTSLNVKRVLKIPDAPAPVAGGAVSGAMAGGASDATANAALTGSPARTQAGKKAASGSSVAKNAPAAPPAQSMPIAIKKIVIEDSTTNFTDLSVAPNFSAGISPLQGTVVGLSSDPHARAKVDLTGSVEAFSPVSIKGEVNVLGPLYADLTMSFRNISLAVFNPYSGKFAGYNITKGKLTTDLHYKVDGRKLDAQHHIVIEQLEFGDKTESKDAVSLPLKLAISLMKDRNGVIDLDIPVTGSLDDPQFRLAPIIWKVFLNVLEKAVTAPFALLGSLFGGGPDIQYIDFRAGDATLDGVAVDKVKTIAKALVERPQLKIDVPIATVPELDGPALVEAAFRTQVTALQGTKGAPKKAAATAGGPPPAYDQLDAATRVDLLAQLYAKDFGADPTYPDAVTAVKTKPELAAAKADYLSKALHDHIVIGEPDYRALGQQRAMALQTALLANPEIVAERVFLVANDKAANQDGAVRVELTLE